MKGVEPMKSSKLQMTDSIKMLQITNTKKGRGKNGRGLQIMEICRESSKNQKSDAWQSGANFFPTQPDILIHKACKSRI